PQNYQHQQTQADPEQNDASETRTAKKLRCDNSANIAEETMRESGQNGSPLSTHHLTNHLSTENAPSINLGWESQNMENMELCISTPSTIRSRASTPTPKPTYSQVTARGRKYNQMDIDQMNSEQ
ncbi:2279_t:CDS:2, partial [Gigaspora rosea]